MTEGVSQRHAIVIGGSSGLGLALANRLISSHKVTAVARRIDRMQELVDLGATVLGGDISQIDKIPELFEEAVAQNGKIDDVIFSAGMQLIKPMRILKPQEISDVITTNLTAAIVCGRMFASPKITNTDAVYCAVSSIAAQRPEPAIIPYAAAKAGLEALIKGLARECSPRRAVGVAPGWLDTEMTQSYAQVYNDGFKAELEKRAPRGIASIEQVVDLILYLLSPSAGSITGQVVTIDGGASL